MPALMNQILIGQYEAALSMLRNAIQTCPDEQWEKLVAEASVRWVAYHTLFFVDYYLSPSPEAFELNEFTREGGDERQDDVTQGLSRERTLQYLDWCRDKAVKVVGSETDEQLQATSEFGRKAFSRAELHIYNIRHVQHHSGALHAYLRRVMGLKHGDKSLRWCGTGWPTK